jgi:hypothetical protein
MRCIVSFQPFFTTGLPQLEQSNCGNLLGKRAEVLGGGGGLPEICPIALDF